jgi:UDP-N-acetylmuramoylalanine--D-glutamate ligase
VIPADEICIPGIHNVENYLAAISAVWGSVSPEAIAGYARSFGGVPHRCELVREIGGVKWYNDSIGTSPSRTIAGLKSFDRRVILIAGGYDKHVSYEELGPVAAGTVKAAILMGETANAIESAISSFADIHVYRVDSMESAVITAQKIAGDGDIVFMSPASASFDLYSDFEERGDHFKRLVMELK